MADAPKEIGSKTVTSRTVYYETPCDIPSEHKPHVKASVGSGSGGGGTSFAGRIPHGNVVIDNGTSYEYWCPGVEG
jgi:hypothetical protein